ncbi:MULTISPECIES: MarR family winged helix-turn-helix transcriptional regulator [unclassified Streptomyces]|uniref:MarR family winged helix-turn-helix transcriptional regulator n=1 Tax=unclassified Streptomyces TaxID=2593676 RepID=UPI000F7A9607|nr:MULTISPECIES: MarR family winged helix-turn-helix transcriptional regulator [unclassified Streptomyces]NUV95661.1 winged helix-turn-helix transcriptional regulator [Streptomyces sp. KAI 90]RSS18207.1 MarR family transcriptional regulator [Streptomyces sp. WAC05458]RSS97947.1 MarR family transcriptional regulator [Streptomyces sp. WAC02707]
MASTTGDTNGRRRRPPRHGPASEATARAGEGSGSGESTGPVAGTRWLNGDEQAAWLANSAIMISLPAALDARMQREAQLTFFEYMVLSVLSEQPDRTMQMSALAARTAASLSRLSHVVGRLEKRGLLARKRIPGSGRRTTATLTEAGYDVVVAAAPGHVAAVREYLIDDLGPQELAALRRIGAAVDMAIKRGQPDAGSAASLSGDGAVDGQSPTIHPA